ncbi:hypothetical protein EMCRGX_G002547 [Ephydatia muelleri]
MLHGTTKLTEKERDAAVALLSEFKDVIALGDDDLGRTGIVQHSIETGSSQPVRQQGRRLPFHQKPVVRKLLDSMLSRDIIEPSHGPWASPVLLVKKKDGSIRFWVDFRKAMRVAGAVKKAGAALGAALGGASAGVTLQAEGPALLQAVAALLLAVAEGPALLQAVAGLLLAVAVGPALLQAAAALLLAVAVGPALLQAVAALLLAVAVGPALLQAAAAALLLAVAVGPNNLLYKH